MGCRMPLPFVVVILVLASGNPVWAQSEGRINGVVRDATGATLPGATVTATNQATSASRTTTAGADGTYSLTLPPGQYTVSATAAAFATATETGELSAAEVDQLDFALQAQLAEEVTVTATKREQTLLDVPFSVAAPTEEVLGPGAS